VSWMHNRTTDQLHFAVDVNTTGWVGFGFTFTPKKMVNYDVIVGGRTSAGRNYLNDFYTMGLGRPNLDASQSYTLDSAAEQNGITSLRFRRARDTNDMRDIQFNVTTRVYLVWAYHETQDASDPNMFGKHTYRNYTMETYQIVFEGLDIPSTPPQTTPAMTTRPTSSALPLGVSFLSISMASVLNILER